jgi:hypothetical protein
MAVTSKELEPSQWRQLGLRMHPEVRKGLKAVAALEGETMEDALHRILVRELRERKLLPVGFGKER